MSPSTFRRKIIVLLLGTALVASATAAADLRSPAYPRPLQFLSQGTPGLLERVAALLGIVWEKEGATIDPYGQSTSAGDNGGSADPYGQSTGASENGGSPDPNGGR